MRFSTLLPMKAFEPRTPVRRFGTKRLSCNSSFFKTWNPSMAYWLGFLFADGNVYHRSATVSVVSMGLKCIDYEHVAKFQNALQSTYKLGLHKENTQSCK
eukprot:13985_1